MTRFCIFNPQETIMTQNRVSNRARASALVAILSVCSAAAYAAGPDPSAPLQVKVSYADLNIASPQGAETLYRRIRSAAGQVCFPGEQRNLALMANRRACIEKAIIGAVTDVGSPLLTAVHEAHEGKTRSAQVASLGQR
jgi:UrcA family protein